MDAEVGFAPFETTSSLWGWRATTAPLCNLVVDECAAHPSSSYQDDVILLY